MKKTKSKPKATRRGIAATAAHPQPKTPPNAPKPTVPITEPKPILA